MLIPKKHTFKQMFIKVNTENEYIYVLHKLDQLGYKWNSGHKLTVHRELFHNTNIVEALPKGTVCKRVGRIRNSIDLQMFLKENFDHVSS